MPELWTLMIITKALVVWGGKKPFAFGFADLANISTTNWAYRSVKLRRKKTGQIFAQVKPKVTWMRDYSFLRGRGGSYLKIQVKLEEKTSLPLTWYDSSPWADVFINKVFSTLPSSDGRKISLKDAFPLGGITWGRTKHTDVYFSIFPQKTWKISSLQADGQRTRHKHLLFCERKVCKNVCLL